MQCLVISGIFLGWCNWENGKGQWSFEWETNPPNIRPLTDTNSLRHMHSHTLIHPHTHKHTPFLIDSHTLTCLHIRTFIPPPFQTDRQPNKHTNLYIHINTTSEKDPLSLTYTHTYIYWEWPTHTNTPFAMGSPIHWILFGGVILLHDIVIFLHHIRFGEECPYLEGDSCAVNEIDWWSEGSGVVYEVYMKRCVRCYRERW